MKITKLMLSLAWIVALSCEIHLEFTTSFEVLAKMALCIAAAAILVGDRIK